MMKLFLIGVTLIIGVSSQIYTQVGPDGYKYPKPQSRFNLPEPVEECPNGGSGPYCCTNGVDNPDCELQAPASIETFEAEPSYPVKPDPIVRVAEEAQDPVPFSSFQSLPPAPSFIPLPNLPKIIPANSIAPTPSKQSFPVKPASRFDSPQSPPPLPSFIPMPNLPRIIPANSIPATPSKLSFPVKPSSSFESAPSPPPLPSFVPVPNLPRIIPANAVPTPNTPSFPVKPSTNFETAPSLPPLPSFIPLPDLPKIITVKPIVASTPAPFVSARVAEPLPAEPLPVDPIPVQQRFSEVTTSANKYLPPDEDFPRLDIRIDNPDWTAWKAKYNKHYDSPEEEEHRRVIFEDNFDRIHLHNKDYEAGLVVFELDSNKFADMTQDEFSSLFTGLKRDSRGADENSTMNIFMPSHLLDADVDDEVDWRKKGAVTPVKNQGSCASCWAFAANGALESQNFLKTGKLVSLSEQNLIDCIKENNGCKGGGFMTKVYDYARTNPGIDTEDSYPYEKKSSTCRFDPANVGAECIAHMEIMDGNELALKQAVATVGPVAAGIDGAQHSFQFYKSGLYFEPKCDTEVNHAVVVVGYGKTDEGEEYWICKNSWDTDWGEEGYIRMARNKNNHCGITSLASYPLV